MVNLGSKRHFGVLGGASPAFFLGQIYGIFIILSESSAQSQLIATLLSNLDKRGGLWTCPKVRDTRARLQAAG